MPGRPLLDESDLDPHLLRPDNARRRAVLRETLARFEARGVGTYHRLAAANLARWRSEAAPRQGTGLDLRVLPGDWGTVAQTVTREWGTTFAVLNMANAYWPGGGYVEGMIAQEENLFRRTDCHYALHDEDIRPDDPNRYRDAMTALLNARPGRVYLDTGAPRVCIRGPEDRYQDDLGYPWLDEAAVFPFYELRAAAVNLNRYPGFDPKEMGWRIAAQLDTMIVAGLRHAVLSAFGCGAFGNPAHEVAALYRDAIASRQDRFDCIVFAIFDAGYGADNFSPFRQVLVG